VSDRQGDRHEVVRTFDAHAAVYDRTVASGSAYHDHLRISARRMGLGGAGAGLRLLDVGCGTGASTAALLEVAPDAEIIAVDASEAMLAQARTKVWPPGVRFVQGDVEELDRSGVSGPFDGIFAAFLLHELDDRNAALRALRLLLKPGAPLAVHEAAIDGNARSSAVWTAMTWGVSVPSGLIRTGDPALTKLLWQRVRGSDGVEALATRMRACGFVDVRVQTMPGWQQRIVHTFLGRRPAGPDTPSEGPASEDPPSKDGGSVRPSPSPSPTPRPAAPSGYGNDAPTPPSGIDMTKPVPEA
jgi:ubiquinone/menaquinone biosynthesis C-methylase UbiE